MNAHTGGIRCFVAVPLEPRLAETVAATASALRVPGSGVKWVETKNLHFTLKFLGEIPQPRVEAARGAVGRAVSGRAPFTVTLRGVGRFPPSGPLRVLWVGMRQGAKALVDLAAVIERELALEGFPEERRAFRPHLTLGRARDPARSGALNGAMEGLCEATFGSMLVERVSLMMSRLTPEGPIYSPIEEWRLLG